MDGWCSIEGGVKNSWKKHIDPEHEKEELRCSRRELWVLEVLEKGMACIRGCKRT